MLSNLSFKSLCFIEKHSLKFIYLALAFIAAIGLLCSGLFYQIITENNYVSNPTLAYLMFAFVILSAIQIHIVKGCESEMSVRYNRVGFHANRLSQSFADLLRSETLGESNLTIKPLSHY